MLLPEERQASIRQRLLAGERLLAATLAEEFHVSEDTARRDLRELAQAGVCRRVYGGALPISPASGTAEIRNVQDQARKRVLGDAAAGLFRSGQIVIIDAGSTNLQVALGIPETLDLTVVTNAPGIAAALMGRDKIELICIGGRVSHRGGSVIGAHALRDLQRLRADICVLGACAADPSIGVTAFDAEEAVFKRTMVERSEQTIVALTNEKLATAAPFGVASLDEIDAIVVEHDAPAAKLDLFVGPGLRIHRAAGLRR